MTEVKDQGPLGSCVAFGVNGALEAKLRIFYNDSSWNVDLSEQHVYEFGGGIVEGGMYVADALNYLEDFGAPEEWCNPYDPYTMFDYTAHEDWRLYTYKIKNWGWLTNNRTTIKENLQNGPLVAVMEVYWNFYFYESGVHNPIGDFQGYHCITLLGYNETGNYWICKNSWGDDWGENGYFKIGYGQCGIEEGVSTFEVVDVRFPNLWVNIHRIQAVDSIESFLEGEAEWEYGLNIWSGEEWLSEVGIIDYPYSDNGDDVTIDHRFRFKIKSNSTEMQLTLVERDSLTDDDVADISGFPGGGFDNFIGIIPAGAWFLGYFSLENGTLSGDPYVFESGWYKTSGDLDGSVSIDENDANIWFNITSVSMSASVLISEFDRLFSSNTVNVIYPSENTSKPLNCKAALLSDWTSTSFITTKLDVFDEGQDTDSQFVNQTTGKPHGEPGIGLITFGGPDVNLMTYNAENNDNAPIHFIIGSDRFYFQHSNGTAISGADLPKSVINHDQDMFVIEVFQDQDSRYEMIIQGFGWKGTYAGGKYFEREIYPELSSHVYNWMILKWEDTNGDDFVNNPGVDTYSLIGKG
jgi:hypothetical protein